MSMDAQQSFWTFEREIRLRTAGLSSNERRSLQSLSQPLAERLDSEPANYVLADLWANRLLEEANIHYSPGQQVCLETDVFSVLKCRLIASRMTGYSEGYNCYCFQQGSMLPAGCLRKEGQAFSTCTLCRTCVRCHKFCKSLGLSKHSSCVVSAILQDWTCMIDGATRACVGHCSCKTEITAQS